MSRMSSTFGKKSRPGSPQKSLGASGSMRRSGSSSSLNRSGGLSTSMSGKLNVSHELKDIEGEYIKNLQQQIYFLELEANFLREQARKATDMHPQMTAEAERMLSKLRQLQSEADGLNLELRRKDSTLDVVSVEKDRVLQRLDEEQVKYSREKRLLLDELVQLKKEKDILERDNSRKESSIIHQRTELDNSNSTLRSSEAKIDMLRTQLDQRVEQHKVTQLQLEDKRSELIRSETNLKDVEDKFYSSTVVLHDRAMNELREEIRMLRQKLRETEMTAEQDRFLKNKMSDDSTHLVKENALLHQQVTELHKQLEREKDLREDTDARRSQSMSELVVTKDREKQQRYELNDLREQIHREQQRVQSYTEQLKKQEHITSSTELDASTTRSKLAELESRLLSVDDDNSQLRRDKILLSDHVAELQRQLQEKDQEVFRLHTHLHSLDKQLDHLEHAKNIESVVQSRKWKEFELIADDMKNMSTTMSRISSPSRSPLGTPRRKNVIVDY